VIRQRFPLRLTVEELGALQDAVLEFTALAARTRLAGEAAYANELDRISAHLAEIVSRAASTR
jgi:hypothetical protein